MNTDKVLEVEKDIKEIDEVLNPNTVFNRTKAENIIRKHNIKDEVVALYNSPINPDYITFENATNEMVKNNLISIRSILLEDCCTKVLKNKY